MLGYSVSIADIIARNLIAYLNCVNSTPLLANKPLVLQYKLLGPVAFGLLS